VELIIAGLNPPRGLAELVEKNENVTLIANPSDDEMFRLIRDAHVNILITFQATGVETKTPECLV